MATYDLVRITPVGSQEFQPGNSGISTGAGGTVNPALIDQIGPIDVSGTMFIPMGPRLFSGYVQFFKSSDQGVTWAPDASGVQVACRNWAADWNPTTGLFTVAYLIDANAGAQEQIQVRQYDPSTETWGANLSAGKLTQAVLSVRSRSNGDILVGHITGQRVPFIGTNYWISILSAGSWTDKAAPNITGDLPDIGAQLSMSVDSTDVLHILWFYYNGGSTNFYAYNQLSVGNVYKFGSNQSPFVVFKNPAGNIIVNRANNWAAVPFLTDTVAGTQMNLCVITDLDFPGPGIPTTNITLPDPGLNFAQTVINNDVFQGPVISTPGDGNIYVIATDQTNVNQQIWQFKGSITDPTGTYAVSEVLDTTSTEPQLAMGPVWDGLVGAVVNGGFNLFFNGVDNTTGLLGRYSLLPAPPANFTAKITLRGVKRSRRCDPDPDVREVPEAPHVRRAV